MNKNEETLIKIAKLVREVSDKLTYKFKCDSYEVIFSKPVKREIIEIEIDKKEG